jgi:hypothetical protein
LVVGPRWTGDAGSKLRMTKGLPPCATLLRSMVSFAALSSAPGCAAPGQAGEVTVLPGSSERLEVAMRFGYLGELDRDMVAGQVRKVMFTDQLLRGTDSSGRLADLALENGQIAAVVAALDGTPRGGRLLDLGNKPKLLDGLPTSSLEVLGREVVYDSLRSGYDEATRAAYVEVSGVLDLGPRGPLVVVATRFDAGPGVPGVLVHTHLEVKRGPSVEPAAEPTSDAEPPPEPPPEPAAEPPLLIERWATRRAVTEGDDFGAVLGAEGGAFVRAFQGSVVASREGLSWSVPRSELPAVGDVVVLSRLVGPLVRADTAALQHARAKALGEPTGELELRVDRFGAGTRPTHHGDLFFRDRSGRAFSACAVATTGGDAHFAVSLPAGVYDVHLHTVGGDSLPARVEVQGERTAFAGLTVAAPRGPAPACRDR